MDLRNASTTGDPFATPQLARQLLMAGGGEPKCGTGTRVWPPPRRKRPREAVTTTTANGGCRGGEMTMSEASATTTASPVARTTIMETAASAGAAGSAGARTTFPPPYHSCGMARPPHRRQLVPVPFPPAAMTPWADARRVPVSAPTPLVTTRWPPPPPSTMRTRTTASALALASASASASASDDRTRRLRRAQEIAAEKAVLPFEREVESAVRSFWEKRWERDAAAAEVAEKEDPEANGPGGEEDGDDDRARDESSNGDDAARAADRIAEIQRGLERTLKREEEKRLDLERKLEWEAVVREEAAARCLPPNRHSAGAGGGGTGGGGGSRRSAASGAVPSAFSATTNHHRTSSASATTTDCRAHLVTFPPPADWETEMEAALTGHQIAAEAAMEAAGGGRKNKDEEKDDDDDDDDEKESSARLAREASSEAARARESYWKAAIARDDAARALRDARTVLDRARDAAEEAARNVEESRRNDGGKELARRAREKRDGRVRNERALVGREQREQGRKRRKGEDTTRVYPLAAIQEREKKTKERAFEAAAPENPGRAETLEGGVTAVYEGTKQKKRPQAARKKRSKSTPKKRAGPQRRRRSARWDREWKNRFDELVRYKAEYGTTQIRVLFDEKKRPTGPYATLYNWTTRMRRLYKTYRLDKDARLGGQRVSRVVTPERIALLTGLGFVFSSKSDRLWNVMFDELVRYKAQFGTAYVPKRYVVPGPGPGGPDGGGMRLGSWCQSMRRLYKIAQQAGRNGEDASEGEGTTTTYLTPERIELLNRFGFPWVADSRLSIRGSSRGAVVSSSSLIGDREKTTTVAGQNGNEELERCVTGEEDMRSDGEKEEGDEKENRGNYDGAEGDEGAENEEDSEDDDGDWADSDVEAGVQSVRRNEEGFDVEENGEKATESEYDSDDGNDDDKTDAEADATMNDRAEFEEEGHADNDRWSKYILRAGYH